MQTIAVTGATGFIGRFVVRALAEHGHRVVTIGRRDLGNHRAGHIQLDLLDPADLQTPFASFRPEVLVHLAWDVTHDVYWNSDLNDDWFRSTARLAEVFQATGGKRVVMAGTCAETSTSLATTKYVEAKRRTHDFLRDETDLDVAWLRVFFPIGPYEHPERLVPAILRTIADGQSFLVRRPSSVRDFCSVRDVGRAFACAAAGDRVGTYDVGTGIGHSLRDVSQRVATKAGSPHLLRFGPVSAPEPLVASTESMATDFGWHARDALDDAIQLAVDWWRLSLNDR